MQRVGYTAQVLIKQGFARAPEQRGASPDTPILPEEMLFSAKRYAKVACEWHFGKMYPG